MKRVTQKERLRRRHVIVEAAQRWREVHKMPRDVHHDQHLTNYMETHDAIHYFAGADATPAGEVLVFEIESWLLDNTGGPVQTLDRSAVRGFLDRYRELFSLFQRGHERAG